jgi:hypothetical protein
MKLSRLAILAAAILAFSGAALADTVDPAIGVKGGGGSPLLCPLTGCTGPATFSFTFTGTQGTTITTQTFDFINNTGSTISELDLIAPASPDPLSPTPVSLSYACADASTYFSTCTPTVLDNGDTMLAYSGGSGIPNDPSPICFEGCSASVPAADFALFVQALNGDLANVPVADQFTVNATAISAVPEPAAILLMSTGLGFLGLTRRRRNQMPS